MVDLITESFCDADFLINLNITQHDIFKKFYTTQNKLYVADTVKDELQNLLNNLGKYEPIYDKLFNSNEFNIQIVSLDDFDDEVVSAIKHIISQYGMKTSKDENLGEFKSALYSIYLEINVLRTCDHSFIAKVIQKSPFKNIQFITLRETLLTFLSKDEVDNLEAEIKSLNYDFNEEKENKKLRRSKKEMMLFLNSKRVQN